MPDTASFPASGRQIYVAFEAQWNGLATVLDKLGWRLCEIPLNPSAPDHDGIPTYCLQPKTTDG